MLGLDDIDHPMIVNCQGKQSCQIDSTILPSTEISGGPGPEPMFCSFVFGQDMLSPRCKAGSLKLFSDVVYCGSIRGRRKKQCRPHKLDQLMLRSQR